MKRNKWLIGLAVLIGASSCTVVKEYEKININDPDMLLVGMPYNKHESYFQVYREGASGANGGKTGGGCGCN